MKTVTVVCTRGRVYSTSINGTFQEIDRYFIGAGLNLGSGGEDFRVDCVGVVHHEDLVESTKARLESLGMNDLIDTICGGDWGCRVPIYGQQADGFYEEEERARHFLMPGQYYLAGVRLLEDSEKLQGSVVLYSPRRQRVHVTDAFWFPSYVSANLEMIKAGKIQPPEVKGVIA